MLKNPNFWSVITFLIGSGLQLGGYQNKYVSWTCFGISGLLFLYALFELALLPGTFGSRRRAFWTLRFGGMIPLHIAGAIAYEEARARGTLWAHAAERLGIEQSPEGILDYVATYFGMKVPIWGVRPPSERLEKIDMAAASHGTFSGGAKKLEIHDQATSVFVDLRVAAKDVRSVVGVMREKVFPECTG